ncbi:leucine-rich repeat and IQ domain-containing protein 3 [Pelodytes ibericus]
MESNYLLSASKSLLLEHGVHLNNSHTEHLEDVALLHLNKLLLKEVDLIQSCTSLTVCNLSNNFITDIGPLRTCILLIKLDLHGNQIQQLPDPGFWRELKNLKLLYLHNNRIGYVSNIDRLSSSPALTALTLFDTPLSLHKRYRHIVVNSIWSLKALDNYVVSDEEIIEDWHLPDRFKAQSANLRVNMLPPPIKDICLPNAMKVVTDLIAMINHILAHCSPVLIVQRCIRGFLTRRSLGIISQPKAGRKNIHILLGPRKAEDVSGDCVGKTSAYSHTVCRDGRNVSEIKQAVKCVNNTPVSGVKSITVDLRKLQKNVLQVLPDTETDCDLGDQIQRHSPACNRELLKEDKKPKEIKSKSLPLQGLYGCEASMSLFIESEETLDETEPDITEQENMEFRLVGLRATIYQSEPLKDLMASNEESAKNIRQSIQQFHSSMHAKPQPTRHTKTNMPSPVSEESKGAMNLQPFYAVDKAYDNRAKYDLQMNKRNLVLQVYTDKMQGKYNIKEFLEEKRRFALEQNETDCISAQQAARRNQLSQRNFIEKVKERQKQFSEGKQQKGTEHSLVREFNAQHISVSNTLLKHDRKIRRDEETQQKIRFLQTLKENEEKQKALAKCLKEQRQLLLQIENASEKVALGATVLQNTQDRLLKARAQVTSMKGQRVMADPMFRIPVNQPVSKATFLK